jgi:hypothetical protein
MQYTNSNLHIPQLQWGRDHEDVARREYEAEMNTKHINFLVKMSGLHIDVEHPFLAASPDGLTECDCCGKGLLEIKCPFTIPVHQMMHWLTNNIALRRIRKGRSFLTRLTSIIIKCKPNLQFVIYLFVILYVGHLKIYIVPELQLMLIT